MVLSPSVFDRNVLALDIASLLQAAAECPQTFHKHFRGCGAEEPDDWQSRGLLRARRERPRCCRADKRDEPAPPHSITSSAVASSLSGISRPNALAALRLMINSNLVASCTGKSAGLAPFKI